LFAQIGGRWLYQTSLRLSGAPTTSEHLGKSVSIAGDRVAAGADRLVVVARCVSDANLAITCGSRTSLAPPTGTLEDPEDTSFGNSISLGSVWLAVGAPNYYSRGGDGAGTAGAVFMYRPDSATQVWAWSYRIYGESGFFTVRSMEFGAQVSMHGRSIAVGAPADWRNAAGGLSPDVSTDESGAAFVYLLEDSNNAVLERRLKASNLGAGDRFGSAVALYQNTLVVGAPGEASSSRDQSSDDAPEAGAAYVFVRDGSVWSQHAYLKAPSPRNGERFGASVAIYGDSVAVGAPGADGGSGRVFVFRRVGSTWSQ
jgi:trimeric autotransporter adhesin